MKTTLRTRLTLTYIYIAIPCILLISIFSNIYLEKYFIQYVKDNQEKKNLEIAALLSQYYKGDKVWDKASIETTGINALEQGLILSVKDLDDNIVWDATTYNSGMCQQMITQMSRNMYSRYPNWKGGYEESSYTIYQASKPVGIVEIGYYGPFYFNDTDLNFINTLNKVILSIGVLALIAALFLGYVMAKRLSIPISRVTKTAQMLERGKFDDRTTTVSNIIEIAQLNDTVNNLAVTLKKQEELRKKLTGDVAHELRTPLATLQSHMEAMIDGIWKADAERLRSCHEEITRLGKMVGDLEKLARYESDAVMLNKTVFDLSELINTILMNFENEFNSSNIQLEFNSKVVKITADRDKVSQIMVNLVSNALKYTESGGKVTIDLVEKEAWTEILVSDTGMGISNEDLPYVFERFYRADKSRNRDTGGTGIGLTIAKAIVDAHQGEIKVSSELGKGTSFIVKLPK